MTDFLLLPADDGNIFLVIALLGLVTYLTRSLGFMVLSRFSSLHPRVEAALEAVPAAVLTTLVLPPALNNGPLEGLAMAAALVASFRLSPIWVLAIGLAIVITGRAAGF